MLAQTAAGQARHHASDTRISALALPGKRWINVVAQDIGRGVAALSDQARDAGLERGELARIVTAHQIVQIGTELFEQVFELGWEEALAEGIVLIEWPERLGALLPKHLDVTLQVEGEGRRALLDTVDPGDG